MALGSVNLLGAPGNPVAAQSLGLNTPQQQNTNQLVQILKNNAPRMRYVPVQPGVAPGSIPGPVGPPGGVPVSQQQTQQNNYLQLLRAMAQRNPYMESGAQAGSPLTMMMMGQGESPPEPVP